MGKSGLPLVVVEASFPSPPSSSWYDLKSFWTRSVKDKNRLKCTLLSLLVIQGSSAILLGRYTRSSVPEESLYEINHLVFVIECVKLLMSCIMEYVTTQGNLLQSVNEHIIKRPIDSCKAFVPAVLYVLQSSLVYIALSNLTAPVFISLQQGKLITTAIVSVSFLQRSYSPAQWVCLVTLAVGVAIIAMEEQKREIGSDDDETNTEKEEFFAVGLLAVSGACFSSAFAGVYFEKMLAPEKYKNHLHETLSIVQGQKKSTCQAAGEDTKQERKPRPSLWIRNVQLAFFSLVFAYLQRFYDLRTALQMAGVEVEDSIDGDELDEGTNTEQKLFLHGFTVFVWCLVLIQAAGGLLVAAVMKYADNVLKGLAMAISVVVASILSALFFQEAHLSSQFFGGATIIVASVYCFSNKTPISLCLKYGSTTRITLSNYNKHFGLS